MQSVKEAICSELARFIQGQHIQCLIVNGVNPDTGEVGRDLDVYVRRQGERVCLVRYFYELLFKYGAKWVVVMDPIWGVRCIGVWENDYSYFELHILTSFRLGPVDAMKVCSSAARTGAYGLLFPPGLLLFKQVINRNVKSIFAGKPIWQKHSPGNFLLSCRNCRPRGVGINIFRFEKFVAALLGEDSLYNKRLRKRGLLAFIFAYIITHPISAFSSQLRSFFRKISIFFSPCVPVVALISSFTVEELQSALGDRLGAIFPTIIVSQRKHNFFFRRKLQAHQKLLILMMEGTEKESANVDILIDTRGLLTKKEELKVICDSIMNGMVKLNAKWSVE